MKKILLSILLLVGMIVGLNAESAELKKQNNYVFDEEQGYAIPADAYCRRYVDIIKTKEEQIKALKQEIASSKGGEQQDLQKQLKAKYDKEMKEIDEKRSKRANKDTTNSIIISDKPTP